MSLFRFGFSAVRPVSLLTEKKPKNVSKNSTCFILTGNQWITYIYFYMYSNQLYILYFIIYLSSWWLRVLLKGPISGKLVVLGFKRGAISSPAPYPLSYIRHLQDFRGFTTRYKHLVCLKGKSQWNGNDVKNAGSGRAFKKTMVASRTRSLISFFFGEGVTDWLTNTARGAILKSTPVQPVELYLAATLLPKQLQRYRANIYNVLAWHANDKTMSFPLKQSGTENKLNVMAKHREGTVG